MNRRRISFGPGAASLLLVVIVLVLSLLSLLTLTCARNDLALSRRSAQTGEQTAGLFARAERSRALLEDALSECAAKAETDADYLGLAAGALPEGMALEGREVIWTEESDGRTLSCRVELAESGALPRTIWRVHRLEATVGAGWTEETFEE